MICKVADFNVKFNNCSKGFENFLSNYAITDGDIDFCIDVDHSNLNQTYPFLDENTSDLNKEIIIFSNKLFSQFPQKNAFVFHASLIEVQNEGIAFIAHSGTGKSTHTLLWQKLLGDKLQIVNGDKPIIRFDDNGIPYGYGSPWCGKEGFEKNTKTPIKHICLIERSKENSCEKISAKDIFNKLLEQLYIPNDPAAAANTFMLLNKLLNSCDIWSIKCNMDISAAETAYNSIFKEKIHEA